MRGEPTRRHPHRVVAPVEPGRVVRRPVQYRGERMCDRVTQDGTPHRSLIRASAGLEVWQYSLSSWTFWLCSSGVSANLVSPVFRLTVT